MRWGSTGRRAEVPSEDIAVAMPNDPQRQARDPEPLNCEEDNDDTYTDGINTFNRKEDRMVLLFLSYTSRMSEGLFRSAMKL